MLVTAHGTGGRPTRFLSSTGCTTPAVTSSLPPISFSVVFAQLGLFGRCPQGPRMMTLVLRDVLRQWCPEAGKEPACLGVPSIESERFLKSPPNPQVSPARTHHWPEKVSFPLASTDSRWPWSTGHQDPRPNQGSIGQEKGVWLLGEKARGPRTDTYSGESASGIPRPTASPGNWLEIQILPLYPIPLKSTSVGVGLAIW